MTGTELPTISTKRERRANHAAVEALRGGGLPRRREAPCSGRLGRLSDVPALALRSLAIGHGLPGRPQHPDRRDDAAHRRRDSVGQPRQKLPRLGGRRTSMVRPAALLRRSRCSSNWSRKIAVIVRQRRCAGNRCHGVIFTTPAWPLTATAALTQELEEILFTLHGFRPLAAYWGSSSSAIRRTPSYSATIRERRMARRRASAISRT